jgi:hypothetical protein
LCEKSFHHTFPDDEVNTAYEAGFSGFQPHRELLKAGIKNIVIHLGQ